MNQMFPCCSVAKSGLTLCDPMDCRLLCPTLSPGVSSNLRSLSCDAINILMILSSVTAFSFCLQSFLASESFPVSRLFSSGGQSIGASASASVLPVNIQDWFPLELTGWISLQSKGLSRLFSSTTIWKHQFFHTQLSYGPTLTCIHDY